MTLSLHHRIINHCDIFRRTINNGSNFRRQINDDRYVEYRRNISRWIGSSMYKVRTRYFSSFGRGCNPRRRRCQRSKFQPRRPERSPSFFEAATHDSAIIHLPRSAETFRAILGPVEGCLSGWTPDEPGRRFETGCQNDQSSKFLSLCYQVIRTCSSARLLVSDGCSTSSFMSLTQNFFLIECSKVGRMKAIIKDNGWLWRILEAKYTKELEFELKSINWWSIDIKLTVLNFKLNFTVGNETLYHFFFFLLPLFFVFRNSSKEFFSKIFRTDGQSTRQLSSSWARSSHLSLNHVSMRLWKFESINDFRSRMEKPGCPFSRHVSCSPNRV